MTLLEPSGPGFFQLIAGVRNDIELLPEMIPKAEGEMSSLLSSFGISDQHFSLATA